MTINILLVDDSSIVRKSIRKTLAMTPLEYGAVFEAENGLEALEMLAEHPVDLLFLDINMPVMNGIDFLRALRASTESFRDTAVVVVSTEGSKVRAEELQALGIRAQLRKPVRPETLSDLITTVLKGERHESIS